MIAWFIFGGLAGWIASILTGTDATMGIWANVAVGVIGAFLGGWIAETFKFSGVRRDKKPTDLATFVVAVLGSILFLAILNLLF